MISDISADYCLYLKSIFLYLKKPQHYKYKIQSFLNQNKT